jgi:hypothetical protein
MHIHGPRMLRSAPRRKDGALRSIRGTNSAAVGDCFLTAQRTK